MALDLPYEDVPDFVADYGLNWAKELNRWLLPRGLGIIIVNPDFVEFAPAFVRALTIGNMRPDGTGHCTLISNGEEFDPLPGGKGLTSVVKVLYIVPTL